MYVDVHNHFVPQRFFEVARKGGEWFGWSLVRDLEGKEHLVLGGKFGGTILPLPDGVAVGADPARRIAMRRQQEGIDVQALSVVGSLWNYHLTPKEGAAFCREVNQELSELQKEHPRSLVGLAILPMQDTNAAMRELEHATKDLGLRALAMATNINGLDMDHHSLWPIYEAASSEKMFIFCHPPTRVAGMERMTRYAFNNTVGLPSETTLAIASLIFGGVLDRYPDLTICFCQGGGNAPYAVGRMHHGYTTKPPAHTMNRPPGEYLNRLYYDCLIHNADSMRFLIERVGADRVVLGTDFPMPDGVAGGTVRWVQDLPFLKKGEKEKILGGNLAPLLGLA